MGRSEDRVSHGVAAAVVVLLHGLMIAALTHALRLGYLVIPRPATHLSAMAVPSLLVTFVASVGNDTTAFPFPDKDLAQGVLRDVQAEIVQPRDFALPDEAPSVVAAAPNLTSKAGEVRILCEVHVHQGRAGDVQAVDLGECTGDEAWQRSLLRSIQQAARLISPTEAGEFPPVRTLYMDTHSPSPEVLARQLSEPVAHR